MARRRQKQDEVWDSFLGRTTSLNPMPTCLQFSYMLITFLSSVRSLPRQNHIPWGHDSQDFVQLGFSGGEEDEYDEDEDMYP